MVFIVVLQWLTNDDQYHQNYTNVKDNLCIAQRLLQHAISAANSSCRNRYYQCTSHGFSHVICPVSQKPACQCQPVQVNGNVLDSTGNKNAHGRGFVRDLVLMDKAKIVAMCADLPRWWKWRCMAASSLSRRQMSACCSTTVCCRLCLLCSCALDSPSTATVSLTAPGPIWNNSNCSPDTH